MKVKVKETNQVLKNGEFVTNRSPEEREITPTQYQRLTSFELDKLRSCGYEVEVKRGAAIGGDGVVWKSAISPNGRRRTIYEYSFYDWKNGGWVKQ